MLVLKCDTRTIKLLCFGINRVNKCHTHTQSHIHTHILSHTHSHTQSHTYTVTHTNFKAAVTNCSSRTKIKKKLASIFFTIMILNDIDLQFEDEGRAELVNEPFVHVSESLPKGSHWQGVHDVAIATVDQVILDVTELATKRLRLPNALCQHFVNVADKNGLTPLPLVLYERQLIVILSLR